MSSSVLPAGSTILVTGANGLVASHTIEQILRADYKVRGTARSAEKLAGLKKRWDSEYGADKFEIAVVEDLLADSVLDESLKAELLFPSSVSGVAHIASILTFGTKREEVVIPTVNMTLNVLKSAAKFPEIKRVVLTSSSTAGALPQPDVPGILIDKNTWNDSAVERSKSLPADDEGRSFAVYAASKTEGERAAFDWVAENRPTFEFNSVLPYCVIGEILDSQSQGGSTSGWIKDLFEGKPSFFSSLPPRELTLSAIRSGLSTPKTPLSCISEPSPLPSVTGQRIWAAAAPYNLDDLLAAFRKLYPSRTFPEDSQSSRDLSVVNTSLGLAILKELGRSEFQSLEASLEQLVGRE